jgi:hypothetical protein
VKNLKNSIQNWSGKKVNNKPKINSVEWHMWRYEIDGHKKIIAALQLGVASPQDTRILYKESLHNLRRFIWYAIGEYYPF